MKKSATELRDAFFKDVGTTLIEHFARHLHDGYADAISKTYGLDSDFKRQLIPQVRHYYIQQRIKKVAAHFGGIGVEKKIGGTEPYCLLVVGGFNLTVSMVKCRGELPRAADFRLANALANDNLFSDTDPDQKGNYNAILAHVPSWDNRNPTSLEVLFPDSIYSCVAEKIDLTPLIEFELEESDVKVEEVTKAMPALRNRLPKRKMA